HHRRGDGNIFERGELGQEVDQVARVEEKTVDQLKDDRDQEQRRDKRYGLQAARELEARSRPESIRDDCRIGGPDRRVAHARPLARPPTIAPPPPSSSVSLVSNPPATRPRRKTITTSDMAKPPRRLCETTRTAVPDARSRSMSRRTCAACATPRA